MTNQSKDDLSVIYEVMRTYQNHPSVKQISIAITASNTLKAISFCFEPTNAVEVQRRLKNIETKKAAGFDKISPKLVKLSAEILSACLSIEINNSLKYGAFLGNVEFPRLFHLTKVNQTKMKFPILGQ